jgi:hypothetical protein
MSWTKVKFSQSDLDNISLLGEKALEFGRVDPPRQEYDTWHGVFLALVPSYEHMEGTVPHYFEVQKPEE